MPRNPVNPAVAFFAKQFKWHVDTGKSDKRNQMHSFLVTYQVSLTSKTLKFTASQPCSRLPPIASF